MNVTHRQREEWERKRKQAFMNIVEELELLEHKIDCLILERDRLKELTIDDSYFEYLAEQGSER